MYRILGCKYFIKLFVNSRDLEMSYTIALYFEHNSHACKSFIYLKISPEPFYLKVTESQDQVAVNALVCTSTEMALSHDGFL